MPCRVQGEWTRYSCFTWYLYQKKQSSWDFLGGLLSSGHWYIPCIQEILRYLQPKFRDRIIKPCGSAMWSDLKSDSPLDLQALLWDVQGVFPKASMKNCKYASRNRSDIPGHSLSPVASPNIENALIFCNSCFQEEMRCSHNINRSTILSFECPYRLKSTECPTAYLCTWD